MDESTTPFVARAREREKLDRLLTKAVAGNLQVAMVTGEAGAGKSSLIEAFLDEAVAKHPELAEAWGQCNSRTGSGDAYLPFRDVLTELTTPPEPAAPAEGAPAPRPDPVAAAAAAAKARKRHTRQILRVGAEALLDVAPDLIGVFVPGGALLGKFMGKVARGAAEKTGALEKIDTETTTAQKAAAPDLTAPTLDEGKIQQQYTAFLRAACARQPIVIILDDLQWADAPSINLLFHLVRELKDSRLMIVGAYRENDVSLGRDDERHPLEPALNEIKRYFGDVWLNLDRSSEEERREMLNALADSEPNTFDAAFRDALFVKTAGHPLFTLELLRDLQERGDIYKDGEAKWTPREGIDWGELPARIEGVVGERIARLDEPLREVLNVAAVEGSTFHAQTIGRVLNQPERQMLKDLSRELDKRHRLIVEMGEVKAGRAILSRFQFANTMLQQYLYEQLGTGERRLWHGDIGDAMEALLGARADDFASELAHHFDRAGQDEKAVHYFARVGERALQVAALAPARNAFSRALEHMREADLSNVGELSRESLQCKLAEVCQRSGALAEAVELLEVCLASARSGNPKLASAALATLSRVRLQQGRYQDALAASAEAVSLAEAARDPASMAVALRRLGQSQWQNGDAPTGRATLQRALDIYQTVDDRRGAASALGELGAAAFGEGDLATAGRAFADAVKLFQTLGERQSAAVYLGNLGVVAEESGDLVTARQHYTAALATLRELGAKKDIAIAEINLGDVRAREQDVAGALGSYRAALALAMEIGAPATGLAALRGLAWVRLQQRHPEVAAEYLGPVMNHPATNADVRRAAEPVLVGVRAALGETACAEGLERGARADLDKVMSEALASAEQTNA